MFYAIKREFRIKNEFNIDKFADIRNRIIFGIIIIDFQLHFIPITITRRVPFIYKMENENSTSAADDDGGHVSFSFVSPLLNVLRCFEQKTKQHKHTVMQWNGGHFVFSSD